MVRLGCALRDDGVSAVLDSVRHQKFKLAGFVATCAQASTVITLDVQVRASQNLGHARHEFKRRRPVGDADAGEVGEFHQVLSVDVWI